MATTDEKPDFIVDPDGNVYDRRGDRSGAPPPPDRPPTGGPPRNWQVATQGQAGGAPVARMTDDGRACAGGVVLLVFAAIFIGRLALMVKMKPEQDAAEAMQRGDRFFYQGQYNLALEAYNRAVEAKPDLVEAYVNRGFLNVAMGQFELALADCNRALELAPQRALVYNNRGAAYLGLGRETEALADFERALS